MGLELNQIVEISVVTPPFVKQSLTGANIPVTVLAVCFYLSAKGTQPTHYVSQGFDIYVAQREGGVGYVRACVRISIGRDIEQPAIACCALVRRAYAPMCPIHYVRQTSCH